MGARRLVVNAPTKVEVWIFVFDQVKPKAKTNDLGLSLGCLNFHQGLGITWFFAIKVLQTSEEEVDFFLGLALAWSRHSIGKGPSAVQGVVSAWYLVGLVGGSVGAVR